jgi:IMP cyclohydrolase
LSIDGVYPGRGVIAGATDEGVAFVGYWLTGRSEASRARRLEVVGPDLQVMPTGAAPAGESPYLVYPAIVIRSAGWVVANGDHSLALAQALSSERRLGSAIAELQYENDPPIFTPRIAVIGRTRTRGLVRLVKGWRGPTGATQCSTYIMGPLQPGRAWALQTYAGDPTRPTTFEGDPYRIDANGGPDAIAASIWDSLDPRFRVAVGVRVAEHAGTSAGWSLINHGQHLSTR